VISCGTTHRQEANNTHNGINLTVLRTKSAQGNRPINRGPTDGTDEDVRCRVFTAVSVKNTEEWCLLGCYAMWLF
jgi:hypothetical protein